MAGKRLASNDVRWITADKSHPQLMTIAAKTRDRLRRH